MSFVTPPGRVRRQACFGRAAVLWARTPRFVRNVAISAPTFLLDLGLLVLLVRRGHVGYLPATVLSFLAANGLSYFLARRLVFSGTKRGVSTGLVYFLAIAALSVLALTPLMWLGVHVFRLDVIVSRVFASCVVGAGGYLFNLFLNFRVAGGQGASRRSRPARFS